jgi:hypothetical protein
LLAEIGRLAFGRLVAGVEVGVAHGAVEIDPVALFEDLISGA